MPIIVQNHVFAAAEAADLFIGCSSGPPGIPVREFPGIPGNLALPNSRREFPGILRKLRSVIFFLLFLHYLSSFITIYNKH